MKYIALFERYYNDKILASLWYSENTQYYGNNIKVLALYLRPTLRIGVETLRGISVSLVLDCSLFL